MIRFGEMRSFVSSILILCASFSFTLESHSTRFEKSTESVRANLDVLSAPLYRVESRAQTRDYSGQNVFWGWFQPVYAFEFSPRVYSLQAQVIVSHTQVSGFHVWARGPPSV